MRMLAGEPVSPIGLGGMPMSLVTRPPEAQSLETLRTAFESGITWVDTADVYCVDDRDLGHNERLIAKAIQAWGQPIRVATKGGCTRPNGAWHTDGTPEHLRAACEASLKALGVATIDVYQLHAPDTHTRFEDSVGELARLRDAGKIRHVGRSNVTVGQIEVARRIVPVVSVQNRCHPLDRRAFKEVLPYCEAHGLAFLPYSPVGGSRDYQKIRSNPALNAVGQRLGASPFAVALAWLLHKSPVMLPIPGASRPASAKDSASAMGLVLEPVDMAELDAGLS